MYMHCTKSWLREDLRMFLSLRLGENMNERVHGYFLTLFIGEIYDHLLVLVFWNVRIIHIWTIHTCSRLGSLILASPAHRSKHSFFLLCLINHCGSKLNCNLTCTYSRCRGWSRGWRRKTARVGGCELTAVRDRRNVRTTKAKLGWAWARDRGVQVNSGLVLPHTWLLVSAHSPSFSFPQLLWRAFPLIPPFSAFIHPSLSF